MAITNRVWYHGSPGKLVLSNRPLFLTQRKDVATQYANGKVAFTGRVPTTQPTVYEILLKTSRIVDMRLSSIQDLYVARREVWNAEHDDADEKMPRISSVGFLISKSGLPSYGHAMQLREMFKDYDGMYFDEGSQGLSLLVFDGGRGATIVGQESVAQTSALKVHAPVLTIINNTLKAVGVDFRLVRGRGYYYFTGGGQAESIYTMWLEQNEVGLRIAFEATVEALKTEDIDPTRFVAEFKRRVEKHQ